MFESGRIEFEDDGETSRLRLIRTGKTSDPISLTDSKWFRAARHSHLCETSFPAWLLGFSKARMLSVRAVYVLSSYEVDVVKPLM